MKPTPFDAMCIVMFIVWVGVLAIGAAVGIYLLCTNEPIVAAVFFLFVTIPMGIRGMFIFNKIGEV